jgi:hemolysin activation/secretion protein
VRETRLPDNWSWALRATGQLTADRLVATEQLSAGGYATVRGYDERVANGDVGIIVNNEIYAPPISFGLGRHMGYSEKAGVSYDGTGSDQLQFLGFIDYGYISSVDHIKSYDPSDLSLSSVGVGMRFKFRTNLSLRVDYGFQIGDDVKALNHAVSDRSRVHIGVVASF